VTPRRGRLRRLMERYLAAPDARPGDLRAIQVLAALYVEAEAAAEDGPARRGARRDEATRGLSSGR
jgi:hypothetical protein